MEEERDSYWADGEEGDDDLELAHAPEVPEARPPLTPGGDPGEAMEAALTQRLSQTQLSQTEQLYLRRLQQGQLSVRQQMDMGTIRPEQGQAMLGAMQQRAQPMMVRASQLPMIYRQLQILQLQRNMAQREAILAENARFQAMTLPERVGWVGGRPFLRTGPWQWTPLSIPPTGMRERSMMTHAQVLSAANRLRTDFRRRLGRDPTYAETQAYIDQQMDIADGSVDSVSGGDPGGSSGAEGAPGGATGGSGGLPFTTAQQLDIAERFERSRRDAGLPAPSSDEIRDHIYQRAEMLRDVTRPTPPPTGLVRTRPGTTVTPPEFPNWLSTQSGEEEIARRPETAINTLEYAERSLMRGGPTAETFRPADWGRATLEEAQRDYETVNAPFLEDLRWARRAIERFGGAERLPRIEQERFARVMGEIRRRTIAEAPAATPAAPPTPAPVRPVTAAPFRREDLPASARIFSSPEDLAEDLLAEYSR